MDEIDFRLINEYQRDFPLCREPFAQVGASLGIEADEVIDRLRRALRDGRVARVGAVFAPRRIGDSMLVALSVAPERLPAIAAIVSSFPEVNHNYEREHALNLWFVVVASSASRLAASLSTIETACGLPLLRLPLIKEYHVDLGFALDGKGRGAKSSPARATAAPVRLDVKDRALVGALQDGLPLSPRPYAELARRLAVSEPAVLERLDEWLASGVMKRFGVVVRHRELGYTANAMLVHDVPNEQVDAIGRKLGAEPEVTLCYRRSRAPDWPYNLFCMIHGRRRAEVEAQVDDLRARHDLYRFPHAVLFSRTRFKQEGARYVETVAG